MAPVLSVIIPCYNHGRYIQEAIDSIPADKEDKYEIIIVDDGSTDSLTIRKMHELKKSGYTVISQQNSGMPACTRNTGISAATGKYILPLDADNKISPEYIYKALPHLESGEYDIVYAKPVFFGSVSPERQYITRPFNIVDLLMVNYIDACAVYRKEVWEQLNGYDIHLPYPGNEDWEFWIHAFTKGFRFKFIDEELFYYRIENNSMVTATTGLEKGSRNQQYIFHKHTVLVQKLLTELYYSKKMHDYDVKHPFRTLFKYMYYNIFKRTSTLPT